MDNDWSLSFAPAALRWLSGQNPYLTPLPFASPPWSLPILAPLAWIPGPLAMILPFLALLFCAYRVRKPWLIPLVGLSFPFLAAVIYANIDWMVMVGLVIGGRLGLILNTVKPQAGIFANLAILSQSKSWHARLELLLPLVVLVVAMIPLYGQWLAGMRTIGYETGVVRNFSLFPYTIPLGLVGLALAWRRQSLLWGVVASLSLAPYFYVHSFMPLLFLVSLRNWRYGLALNLVLWGVLGAVLAGVLPIRL